MFRPFLPCGIAYGFAYALPMLCLWLCLWHSMLFFRRKASRRVVCIVPYRRGACQPVSAEFRRHLPFSGAGGCPRVGGGIAPALQARRALAAPYGAEPQRHLFTLPRGRGPSQTPPSLATDSSISPGPPSPWLPALLIGNRFCRCCAGLEIPKAHPRRVPDWQVEPVPRGFSPGDARGEAPCI